MGTFAASAAGAGVARRNKRGSCRLAGRSVLLADLHVRPDRTQMFGHCLRGFRWTNVLQTAAVVDRAWLRAGGKIIFALKLCYLPCKKSPNGGKLKSIPIPNNRKAIALILPIGSDLLFHDRDRIAHKNSQTMMAVVVTPERGPVGW
jgi:hypothetical protein